MDPTNEGPQPVTDHAASDLDAPAFSERTLDRTMVTFERALEMRVDDPEADPFDLAIRYAECVAAATQRANAPSERAQAAQLVVRCAKTILELECPPVAIQDWRGTLVDSLLNVWGAPLRNEPRPPDMPA